MAENGVSVPLKLEGAYNVRDLGGYPTSDGGVTRHGVFLRSDRLDTITGNDQKKLWDYGVRMVVDLRSEAEQTMNPDALLGFAAEYVCFPMLDQVQSSFFSGDMPEDMGALYVELAETGKETMARLYRKMMNAQGCVLYHCTAGKDRTGVVTALLLKLAGVADEMVIANYTATEKYVQPLFDKQKAMMRAMGIAPQEALFRADPAYITAFLEYLASRYGTAQTYLESAGLTGHEIKTLRSKLV